MKVLYSMPNCPGCMKRRRELVDQEVKFKYVEDRLGHDKRYSLNSWKYIEKFDDEENIKLYNWLKEIIK